MKVQRSIVIKAPAEKIWPLLTEPENIIRWCTPVVRILRTGEQHSGLGTTFYFEERAVGRLMKLNFVVTEWISNQTVTFKMTSGNLVKGYQQRYTLETTPAGIKVSCFENVILPFGILGKFAGLFRIPVSNGLLTRMLIELKVLAEA
jgi:hypothetical protein